MTIRRAAAILVAVLLAAMAARAALPPRKSDTPGFTGQAGVFVPERTEDGIWDGTWFYNSVDAKIALWMRTRRGKVEARVRYQSGKASIGFETDWTGVAAYHAFEHPASFAIKFSKTGPGEIAGTWSWTTRLHASTRTENGSFTLFRARDGRTLVMEFKDYELVTIRPTGSARATTSPAWTFLKASKREALWDEIPF